jgi:hypothetical protein
MPDYSLLFVLFRLAVTSPVSLLSNAISKREVNQTHHLLASRRLRASIKAVDLPF